MRCAITRLSLGIVLTLCDVASAGSPTATLQAFVAIVDRVLEDPATQHRPEEQLAAVRAAVHEIFDARGAARLALGPEWDARSAAEQEEFAALFASLFERSFLAAFVSRARAAGGHDVAYLGESIDGATATVRTAVTGRNGDDLRLDYRMVERDGRFLVRDVVIDGVSLAANFRAQFARVIQASSYGGLVARMRARTDSASPLAVSAAPRPSLARAPAESGAGAGSLPESAAPGPETARALEPPHLPMSSAAVDRSRAPAHRPAVGAAPSRPRGYWVQVGAFKSPAAAHRLKTTLSRDRARARHHSRIVVSPPTGGHGLARVRIGPFRERAQAASAVRHLEATGYRPFVAAPSE